MGRKRSKILEKMAQEYKENPVVEQLENLPVLNLTKAEHIKELQELLVQTCIDYINKNGLTDIYDVSFRADALNESAEYGSWQPCTDSYINVEGITVERYKRKNGKIMEMRARYKIGERY